MNPIVSFVTINILIVCYAFPMMGFAQRGEQQMSQQEMMAAYMELAKPGEEHQLLAQLEGKWDMEITMWMQPGAEPQVFTGSCENSMILGGRFLLTESQSGEDEMYTETHIITGYDRRYEHFTQVGFDTWGTYYVTAAGPYDEQTKTITMYGEDEDPVVGKTQKYNLIIKYIDENAYKTEVIFKDFRTPGEEPFKIMEITYTRL